MVWQCFLSLEMKKVGQIAVGAESIQINDDRLNNVKCEVVDISGTKAGNVWETTLTSCLKYIAK